MPFYQKGQLQLFQFNFTSSKWGFDLALNVSATGITSGVTNLGESIAMTPDGIIIAAGAPTPTSGELMYQQHVSHAQLADQAARHAFSCAYRPPSCVECVIRL
jgi:hypothetical protein